MARKAARTTPEDRPFPSREEVLAFIADHPGQAGVRELARAFSIKGRDRTALRDLVRELGQEGLVARRGRRLRRPADLPSVTVLQVTGRDAHGELLAEPVEWPAEEGSPPKVALLRGRDRRAPAAGAGDRVLARLSRSGDGGPGYTGRIIKVLDRKPETVLGVLRTAADGARIEPVDRKQRELIVEDAGAAAEGDLVAVAVTRGGRYGLDRARVTEVIGSMKNEKAVSLIAILSHGIPYEFPREAVAEAEAARPAGRAGREDRRRLPLVTIDPADARDHDDAVHAAPDDDPGNKGGFVVTVAIADVAHYVRPGSALDREALKRGNSVYFPDRVVPMLPERISNDLCSLREGQDRPALAVRMVFAAGGRKIAHRFHRITMRSAARLSYEEAQEIFDGRTIEARRELAGALADLWEAYQVLKRGREARAPLELDLPERKVIVGRSGAIERIVIPERLEAHRLIEEFMIQANVAAAETLEAQGSPLVYRIHDTPSLAKLEALREFLKSIEMTLPRSGNLRPGQFNRILELVRASEHAPLVNEVVLRTQAQAEYSPENIGHFGLNLRRYAHFTSPIRRYADLIVHRALIRALGLGKDGLPDGAEAELPVIAAQISAAERRAMAAERDTIDRLVAHWLADRVGATFAGRISGVTRAGLFVRLDSTGADGFVPMSTLGSDYYVYDEARHAVIGRHGGEMHRLGDPVEVRLVEAAPLAGALRFALVSGGRIVPRQERPKESRHRRGQAGPRRGRGR